VTANKKTSNNAEPKRRWLNIGPGIVLALAISALIGARYIKTEIAARRQPDASPIIERQVMSSSYGDKSGPIPEVSFIIDRAGKLHITDAQLAHLKALQSKWRKFYVPKIAQANKAAAKTHKYLADAEGNSRTPLAQIESAAAPVVALSREISAARRSYWSQAVKILTPNQRKALQAERETAWAEKTKALSPAR
jgi:hypothetical protein